VAPLTLHLKPSELGEIRYRLSIEEPRVIRRANILNCLHLGYVSSDIAKILNVDPKTVTNVASVLFTSERTVSSFPRCLYTQETQ